jgi:transposase InsO family protein
MKYAFIHGDRHTWPILVMCRVLKVQRSGYYAWCHVQMQPGKRAMEHAALLHAIREVHRTSKERYGAPRVTAALRKQGWRCSRGRVARLMNANAIKAKRRYSYRVTTRSNHLLASPNRIERNFTALEPDRLWVTDMTYIETREGFLYAATIMDLFSRKIVGLAMRADLSKQLVIDALIQALQRRKPKPGLVLHSDRGTQYCAWHYRELLHTHGILQSMSRKGDCWDNAPMESFFKTLKVEEVYQRRYATRDEARQSIFEYIEIFYNRQRLHSALGYETPENFEAQSITDVHSDLQCLSN